VEAIGADRKEFERSAAAQRFRQWVADYGLGFSVRSRSKVVVPAYVGALQLSSAHPGDAAADPTPHVPGGR
jgi:hypothetical protein